MSDPAYLASVAARIAGEAARRVRTAAPMARTYATKSSPTDVVTQTDLTVEAYIRGALLEIAPGSALAGEEYADVEGSSGVGWVIDPIDGTVNYLYGLPFVSVSIAATLDGEVVAGVVADVFGDEIFTAVAGAGASVGGSAIHVNGSRHLSRSLLATGFSYDASHRRVQASRLATVMGSVSNLRCLGSAALHLCAVATGRLDGYFETDLKPWDYAAGVLVAREAGAAIRMPSTGNGDMLIASTPAVFSELSDLLERSFGCPGRDR